MNSFYLDASALAKRYAPESGTPLMNHLFANDDALVRRSLGFIGTHSINGTDAIILQSALDTATGLRAAKDDLVLVASDSRLLRAAQAEKLMTFNPETQSLADLNALL